MAFSLERTPTKGAETTLEAPRNAKRRRLSDAVIVEQGPRPPMSRKLPDIADIEVAIYKYTDDAATVWGAAKEAGLTLWQLQLRHDAKTSVLVNAYI